MAKKELLIEPGKQGIKKMFLEKIRLDKDESISNLIYDKEESFYFIVNGYGMLNVDVYKYALEQQLSIYIPPKIEHSFLNTGESSLLIIRYGCQQGDAIGKD